MYKAALFDIDGALVDSNDAHAHAWVEAFAEFGIQVDFARVRGSIGMGGDKLMPAVSGISEESPLGERISKRRGEIASRCGGWSDVDLRGALAIYDGPWDLLARIDASPSRGSMLNSSVHSYMVGVAQG